MKRFIAAGLAVVMAAMMTAGCSGSEKKVEESAAEGKKEFKIAMVAAGVFGDQGMNDALLNGMKMFKWANVPHV